MSLKVLLKSAEASRGPCRPAVTAAGRTQSLGFHGYIAIVVKASDKPLPASANFSKTFHISANIWEEVFSKREEATRNHFAVVEGASADFNKILFAF